MMMSLNGHFLPVFRSNGRTNGPCIFLRLEYRIGMAVPRQLDTLAQPVEKGPRARTRRLMVETADAMMRAGLSPSVSEVAETAGVSRSTAYRYFPTRAAMIRAVIAETLGPILAWQSSLPEPGDRVAALIEESFPRIESNAATFRAALKLSLELQSEADPEENKSLARGHRLDLLERALAPVRATCSDAQVTCLTRALSMIFGIEGLVVLKDICGIEGKDATDVARWAARALVDTALAEASHGKKEA
jgi:AcrR family transcriptional regulator